MKCITKISGILGAGFLFISSSSVWADITNREVAQAIINYDAYSRAVENYARAQDVYAPAPQVDVFLNAAVTLQQADAQVQSLFLNDLYGSIVGNLMGTPLSDIAVPSASSALQNVLYPLQIHFNYFCSSQESAVQGCNQTLPYGDLSISSLLGSSTVSTTTNPLSVKAAEAVISSIIQPNTSPVIGNVSSLSNLSQAQQRELSRRYSEISQSSVAMNSLYHMLIDRIPPTQQSGQTSSTTTTPQSLMQTLQTEATRRFTDPTWATALASTPDSGILRELAHMEAFRLYMDFQKYQQMERIEALLATLLSKEIELTRVAGKITNTPVSVTPNSNGTSSQ